LATIELTIFQQQNITAGSALVTKTTLKKKEIVTTTKEKEMKKIRYRLALAARHIEDHYLS